MSRPSNPACALLGCTHPVVLAGMGGPARSELVAAVTAAGGFGFLGMVREPPALIVREVEALRQLGHQRFGVNIIPAATDGDLLEAQLAAIIALRVPVVALFWDIDPAIVARLRDAGIVVVYQVGSPREAEAAAGAGAQVIIAQGREAGGHVRGTTPLRALLPAVVGAVDLPVLAAGGLATGADLVIAQALGAHGIVLGTAFLATAESFAHPYHKERLVAARAADTVLTTAFRINWPPGAPVRVLRSAVTADAGAAGDAARTVIGSEDGRPIYRFSTDSPLRSMTGDFASMALYAGTGVGAVTRIRPAAEVLADIVAGAALELIAGDPMGELSSPACYLGEVGGAYAGELTPNEVGAEIAVLLAGLAARLSDVLARAGETPGDGPPFPDEAVPVARWIARFTPSARAPRDGAAANPPRTPAAMLDRIGRLAPRLPEGRLRAELVALRLWLEQERAAARA